MKEFCYYKSCKSQGSFIELICDIFLGSIALKLSCQFLPKFRLIMVSHETHLFIISKLIRV